MDPNLESIIADQVEEARRSESFSKKIAVASLAGSLALTSIEVLNGGTELFQGSPAFIGLGFTISALATGNAYLNRYFRMTFEQTLDERSGQQG